MRRISLLLLGGLIGAHLLAAPALADDTAAKKPIVAIWLNRHLMAEGEKAIVAFVDDCAKRGVTHILPNFWFHGFVIYPGSELVPQHKDFVGWNPLAVVVREAHARGLLVMPWSEYGFYTHYNTTLDEADCGWILEKHPDWKTADKEGHVGLVNSTLGVMHFSMNPAFPEARKFLIDLHLEMARRYEIDGINTDRVRYMGPDWGYDPYSLAAFEEERARPGQSGLTFDEWRAEEITSYTEEFANAWRAEHPKLPISAAVNPPGMYQEKFQYFDNWQRHRTLDMPVPMIYGKLPQLRTDLEKVLRMLPPQMPVVAGIDGGQGEAEFADQVAAALELGAAGVCIWDDMAWRKMTYSFAEPVNEPTPTTEPKPE